MTTQSGSDSTMKITAIAPWFGSKRTLAPKIVAELGKHSAYWEPFCGAMSVLLAKPPASMETVNDLHGDLINLARVIQDDDCGPAFYRRLRRTWLHDDTYAESLEMMRTLSEPDDGMHDDERAYWFFVKSWMERNGYAGTQGRGPGHFAVRYTKNGGHGATRVQRATDSIPAWRRRMRQVTILRRDGFDLLDRIEDARGVVIYIDPPYIEKNAKYVHDFELEDHHRLSRTVRRFQQTRVVISYYDDARIRDLYEGWAFVSHEVTKGLSNESGRGTTATELLIINGPSYTTHERSQAKHAPLFTATASNESERTR